LPVCALERKINDLLIEGVELVLKKRRFPPPWSVEEQDACFVVRDAHFQPLSLRLL
jgi:hypothetical protein